MAKRRKMLGDIQSTECRALMTLMETQSKKTLALWASAYAKERYLPLFQAVNPESAVLEDGITACERCLAGEIKLTELKPFLKKAREMAAAEQEPVAQAAARAISTACSAIQTPTNAFGCLLYGAAAVAYAQAGLEAEPEEYDRLAAEELSRALSSLEKAAGENEPNPAKINWNC